ncbi:MAG: hypothetical protein IK083_01115 [Abditibacteriota bacterium]|nr:hypothetical protein [Abditibacteriota bacterium]
MLLMLTLTLLLLSAAAFAGPARIFTASDYARLDSDVVKGGGTDDTAALQALLDKASDGTPVKLIMDGAALITGLTVWPNTTIECVNQSCGFFLKDGCNCAIIRNRHADFYADPEARDKNISLIGGTWNHNAKGQKHDVPCPEDEVGIYKVRDEDYMPTKWVMAFELYGVENLLMKDMTIMNQRTFTALIANFKFVNVENVNIVLNDYIFGNNQDGFHFFGPGQFLNIRNISGTAGDDFIAVAPDERDRVSSITDVMIDGVHLNDSDQGIRLLCREEGTLERVLIKNVTGTYRSFGFYINPWFESKKGGCYRDIVIDTVALECTKDRYPGSRFLFSLGGNIESMILKNIHYKGDNPHHLLEVRSGFVGPSATRINNLTMENVYIQDDPNVQDYIAFMGDPVPVRNLLLKNIVVNKEVSGGSFITAEKGADIERLIINGFYSRGLTDIYGPNIRGNVKKLVENNINIEDK